MASRVSHGRQRHNNGQRLLEVCGSVELAGGISYDVGLAIRRLFASPSKSRNETVVLGGIGKKNFKRPSWNVIWLRKSSVGWLRGP